MSEGTKHDQGKPRPELVPPSAVMAAARVFEFGARKYSANNWRHGIKYSRLYGALLRHLMAWWDGEDLDPESGEHHLAHALCCLMMLVEHWEKPGFYELDDRVSGRLVSDDNEVKGDDRVHIGVDTSLGGLPIEIDDEIPPGWVALHPNGRVVSSKDPDPSLTQKINSLVKRAVREQGLAMTSALRTPEQNEAAQDKTSECRCHHDRRPPDPDHPSFPVLQPPAYTPVPVSDSPAPPNVDGP